MTTDTALVDLPSTTRLKLALVSSMALTQNLRTNIIVLLMYNNHFVLPIANPFLSCSVAFYINRSSNKRSFLNKRTINNFLSYNKPIAVTPGSRRKPIALATAGAICLNWAVTCRIRDQPPGHTSINHARFLSYNLFRMSR